MYSSFSVSLHDVIVDNNLQLIMTTLNLRKSFKVMNLMNITSLFKVPIPFSCVFSAFSKWYVLFVSGDVIVGNNLATNMNV